MPEPSLSDLGYLLRSAAAHISDTIIVITDSLRVKPGPGIVFVNEAIEHLTGYAPHELIGQPVQLLLGPGTDRRALARLRAALREKVPYKEQIAIYSREGVPRPLEMRFVYVPLQAPEGRGYFVGIGDKAGAYQTQQNPLQHLERWLRHIHKNREAVREQERARIARDLHDDLGQTLTAMKLQLELLLIGEEPLTAEQQARLRRVIALTDGTVDQIRQIASNLRPSLLDHAGFVEAARWYVEQASQHLAARLTFEAGPGYELPLVDDAGIGLYRALQEALTNVSRHARARNVRVRYAAPNNQPRLEVHDDGVGFEPESAARAGSLGLLGLRERALMLGGRLTIDSAPGRGCTITIELPEQYEKDQNCHC